MTSLKFKWTVSKARDSYGYNICTLFADGEKVARTCGGGYDMQGTVLGNYIARRFAKELLTLTVPMNRRNGKDIQEFYGLTYHDPDFDPGQHVPANAPVFGDASDVGKTVAQLEAEDKSLGLERYQAFYSGSSRVPTATHIIPLIDGACGFSCVCDIVRALGYSVNYVSKDGKDNSFYILEPLEVGAVR